MEPENDGFWRISSSTDSFSGSILVFRGVTHTKRYYWRCFVWQVLQSEIPTEMPLPETDKVQKKNKKAIKDIQGNRGHREITSTSIERVMFKLSLFNVLNGQRFACSEKEALGNVSLVLWIAGKSSWFKKIQRLRPGLAGIINSPWVKSDKFSALFAFLSEWGGRAAQKYKISTDDTSPTSRNCQKYVDEKNTWLFACFFFLQGGGGISPEL